MKFFVTVGSMYPMDRVIKEVDEIASKSTHNFFCQIGKSKLKPKNVSYAKFLDYESLKAKIAWADVIISHAGAGSIIDAISMEKKLILVPRLAKFGEAIDDHQIEMCKALEIKYGIRYTEDEKALLRIISLKSNKIIRKRKKTLINILKKVLVRKQ